MLEVHGDIKRHIDGIKWIGVAIIMTVVVSVPGIVLISQSPRHTEDRVIVSPNDTTCVFVKRYNLTERIYLTVCNLNGYVTLDIRQFLNNTPTVKGIALSLHQWLTLKQMIHPIDTAIDEARTYWLRLRRLNLNKEDGMEYLLT